MAGQNLANWYDNITLGDDELMNNPAYRMSKISLSSFTDKVQAEFNKEVKTYKSKSSASQTTDRKWIDDIIRNGTLSDRVAALALQIQESPVHHLDTLDELISLASKKEQRTAQLALEALKDLLIHNLLPNRRLRTFLSNPLGHPKMDIRNAVLLFYESELSKRMEPILSAFEVGLKSTLDFFKRICMELICDWLINKPEQEARLLSMLVNKLGDPKGLISSKAIELMKSVLSVHPSMKPIVILELKQFIFRSGISAKAVYNAVVFLTQITVSKTDSSVASQLIEIYVGLFEKSIEETDSKEGGRSNMLSMLLTGISRAFPALEDKSTMSRHLDAIFRIVHNTTFATATRALILLSHIAVPAASTAKVATVAKGSSAKTTAKGKLATDSVNGQTELCNRFYRALYSKLSCEEICTRAHNANFLNLLYRSMKNDPSDARAMAFLKRLTITASQCTAPIAAAILLLISEVFKSKKSLLVTLSTVETSPSVPAAEGSSSGGGDADVHSFGAFDASKREPAFAAPVPTALWEVSLLTMHVHPTVQVFAKTLLSDESDHLIAYAGDPTADLSLTSFLNRFSYKNPKKQQLEKATRRVLSTQSNEAPVNSIEFQLKASTEVEPDKTFFHKFFGARAQLLEEGRLRRRRKKKSDTDEGDEIGSDVDVEEFEMDKFADQLADDLLRGDDPEGPDIDDDGDDDDDFDDDTDRNGRDVSQFGMNDDDDDDDESGDEDIYRRKNRVAAREVDEEDEDEDEDFDESQLETFDDDDDDESEGMYKKKRLVAPSKKRSKKDSEDDFADAADYEEEIDALEYKLFASEAVEDEKRNTVMKIAKMGIGKPTAANTRLKILAKNPKKRGR